MSIIQGTAHTSAGGYQIERSLRFNSADSAYFSRTPASAGNRRTFTISYWIKRSALGSTQYLFAAGSGTTESTWFANALDTATVQDQIGTGAWTSSGGYTNAVLRDPSAWYHIVIAIDTTQATASNRSKLYINGVLQTYTGAVTISQNADLAWNNSGVVHYIGARLDSGPRMFFDGYLTEVYNIDGQALTPSSFGQSDPNTGVWSPIKYTGTYGTNGFYVNFSDNSNTTAATLGKDSSGNGNNWTPNNFSVTAGTGNDSLVDTPTSYGTDTGAGGEVRGNYATLNPLASPVGTYSNGNLDWVGVSGQWNTAASTIFAPSGKYYFEVTAVTVGTTNYFGIGAIQNTVTYAQLTPNYLGVPSNSWGFYWNGASSSKANNNVFTTVASGTIVANDILQCAIDVDNGRIWFGRNNTWVEGSPSAGTGASFTNLTGSIGFGISIFGTAEKYAVNFGQRPFAYTAPSGFKALCTQNLPTPTIGATSTTQANDYMNVVLYTGNGGTAQNITGVGFQPDFVWIKSRNSGSFSHRLYDAVRGAGKELYSNATAAESTVAQSLTAFISDGFSLGTDTNNNATSTTYVAWNWKGNGAGSSNTAGTITSTVSTNTTAGFSIVTYTGNGVDGATVGHGLGAVPNMVIIKRRDVISDWNTKHSSLSSNNVVFLNTTDAQQTPGSGYIGNLTSSTVITLVNGGAAITNVNGNGNTYVAYCFAEVAGYSAFGSYTGNGSNDGVFVYTGFRPRWILVKRTDSTGGWHLYDTARDTYNAATKRLQPNLSNAENTANGIIDILSNGWKFRNTNTDWDASGGTYIYAAFAESPFKYALAR